VAVLGLSSTAGRLVIGRAAQTVSKIDIMQLSMVVSGVCVVGMAVLPPKEVVLVLIALLFGFFAGSVGTQFTCFASTKKDKY
jgi:predicted MFS family arabinose efflux permease